MLKVRGNSRANMYQSRFLLLFAIAVFHTVPIRAAKVCHTAHCKRTASELLAYMDLDAKPCHDFYQFACGRYLKESVPAHLSARMFSTAIALSIDKQLKQLVEERIRHTDPRPYVLIKKLYSVCMNSSLISTVGLKEMNEILEEVGGWPLLRGDSWKGSDYTWEEIAHKISKMGFQISNFLMNVYISRDLKHSSKNVIYLDQAPNILYREASKEMVKTYYEYMIDTAVSFGAERESARKELLEVLNFEMQLSGIAITQENRRDYRKMYNVMTLQHLSNYTDFHWQSFINKLWVSQLSLNGGAKIVVMFPKYWIKFVQLMRKTPKRTVINYILWKTVSGAVDFLTEALRSRQLRFTTFLSGIKAWPPRWQECIRLCQTSLNIAASSMHIRKHYNAKIEPAVKKLMSNIRSHIVQNLRRNVWIDVNTKKHALEKLNKLYSHVGPPKELKDYNKLSTFYESLEVNEKSFLRSMLAINIFNEKKRLEELKSPVKKSDWTDHSDSLTVDAYYRFQENSMQIPASILREPMYSKEYPQYMNYGGLGYVIGHELTHALDDQGKQFDKNGNLRNWWQANTSKAFASRAQCFINHFNRFNVTEVGLKVNGFNTQSENIADHGGLKNSYWSYIKWTKTHKDPQLPGLAFNGRQMFWLAAAHSWCAKILPQTLRMFVLADPHAPPMFRILGTFSNLDAFNKDFKCGRNAKMNPKKKCNMW